MKNISEGLTSKLDTGEVRNSELEDISLESTKVKTKEYRLKEQNVEEPCHNYKRCNILITKNTRRRKRDRHRNKDVLRPISNLGWVFHSTKQFLGTSWEFYHLTQFWHYLPNHQIIAWWYGETPQHCNWGPNPFTENKMCHGMGKKEVKGPTVHKHSIKTTLDWKYLSQQMQKELLSEYPYLTKAEP